MIDFDIIKNYLSWIDDPPIVVKRNTLISKEESAMLADIYCNCSSSREKLAMMSLFEKPFDAKKDCFKLELSCEKCGKTSRYNFTKTKLKEWFDGSIKTVCADCYLKIKTDNKAQREKEDMDYELKNKSRKLNDTKIILESFILSDNPYDYDMGDYLYYDIDVIKKSLCNLQYDVFLQTPYWKYVATRARKRADFKCQLCNNKGYHVHHKTYENHGDELNHLKDLVVLCSKCHEKFHDIIPNEEKK